MVLDYVLENNSDHYLESEAEKIRFFAEGRGIAPEVFTDCTGKLFHCLRRVRSRFSTGHAPLTRSCALPSSMKGWRPRQSFCDFFR